MSKPPRSLGEMSADAARNGGGLSCPSCGCADFRTYGTDQGQSTTFRYKYCRHCGHKIVTATVSNERIIRDVRNSTGREMDP